MSTYFFRQYSKFEYWKMIKFQIEAESKEKALEELKKNVGKITGDMLIDPDLTDLDITSERDVNESHEYIFPSENDGQVTSEIYSEDSLGFEDEFLADNVNGFKNK